MNLAASYLGILSKSYVGFLRRKSNLNYRTVFERDKAYISYKDEIAENYVYTQLRYMCVRFRYTLCSGLRNI